MMLKNVEMTPKTSSIGLDNLVNRNLDEVNRKPLL